MVCLNFSEFAVYFSVQYFSESAIVGLKVLLLVCFPVCPIWCTCQMCSFGVQWLFVRQTCCLVSHEPISQPTQRLMHLAKHSFGSNCSQVEFSHLLSHWACSCSKWKLNLECRCRVAYQKCGQHLSRFIYNWCLTQLNKDHCMYMTFLLSDVVVMHS